MEFFLYLSRMPVDNRDFFGPNVHKEPLLGTPTVGYPKCIGSRLYRWIGCSRTPPSPQPECAPGRTQQSSARREVERHIDMIFENCQWSHHMDHNSIQAGKPLELHLRSLRQMGLSRQLTQQEVAALTGIDRKRLSRFETGARIPSALELLRLALGYKKELLELFAPWLIEQVKSEIEENRVKLGLQDQVDAGQAHEL